MSILEENKRIADHYGYEAQSNQLVEECAELIQAVNKYRRAKRQKGILSPVLEPLQSYRDREQIALDSLIEEIVDVEIMLEQIKYLLQIPEEYLIAAKQYKINRTKERMEQR